MSPDTIGMIITLFTFTLSVLGGVHVLLVRQTKLIDSQFAQVDRRFEQVDARFDKLDARMDKLDDRVDRVEGELVDIKVAIARLEGPLPKLQRI